MFSKYSSRPSVLIEPLSLSICEMLADISFARIPFYPDLCIIYEERTDAGRPLFLSELLRSSFPCLPACPPAYPYLSLPCSPRTHAVPSTLEEAAAADERGGGRRNPSPVPQPASAAITFFLPIPRMRKGGRATLGQ